MVTKKKKIKKQPCQEILNKISGLPPMAFIIFGKGIWRTRVNK